VLAEALPNQRASHLGWNVAADQAVAAGRYLLALSMAIFGLDHFLAARFVAGLIPGWIPWHLFWVYFTGAGFVAVAICLAAGRSVALGAALLGIMFFLWVVLVHSPRVAGAPRNGNEWNSAFVAVAMCGAAWIVAGNAGRGHGQEVQV
jgi:hypothetical protein